MCNNYVQYLHVSGHNIVIHSLLHWINFIFCVIMIPSLIYYFFVIEVISNFIISQLSAEFYNP